MVGGHGGCFDLVVNSLLRRVGQWIVAGLVFM